MFKYKILGLLLLCCMDTFSPCDLCLYKNLKKLASMQVTCKTVAFSTLVQPTESRELHTHRTIVDGEKKSTTARTPRCPDNRRELGVHATTVVVVVVFVITYIAEYKSTGRLPILFT